MINRKKRKLRYALAALGVVLALAALLAVDLGNRGLFWRFAWSVTGREEPLSQVRGVLEWLVTQTRPRPRTEPLTPVRHGGEYPYGINTFLQLEADPGKVEAQLAMIADAGFGWIRQQFPWEDIEIHARGDFEDRRNVEAVGVLDAWAKYDRIVEQAERYDLRIQARLDNPPHWSRVEDDPTGLGPPDDLDDFVNYAVAVAERYRGRIHHYQIWNEPNIYPEWGDQPVDPEAYTDLLCRAYAALKAVDADIVVISGALAPTIALTGQNLNDFIFLQRMYNAGAGDCFDVLSVQGYGLFSGPTDRRMRPTTINIARNLYIRDLMIANGDADKAIWMSEAAWNFVPTADEVPGIANRTAYGQVTPQQAADYIPQLYQRAQREWPWVGVINYWFFTRPDDSWWDRPEYYFRMVEPDYDPDRVPPFTPLPVYDSMREHIAAYEPALYPGAYQAEHWAIERDDAAETVAIDGAHFGQALAAEQLTFTAHGTEVIVRWQGEALTANGQTFPGGDGWGRTTIHRSTLPQTTAFTLTLESGAVDTITVLDRAGANLLPYVLIALLAVGMLALAVIDGLRERRR
jgi:polysaccharide biosynthesis protein PslG